MRYCGFWRSRSRTIRQREPSLNPGWALTNDSRSKVEVVSDDLDELGVRLGTGAVRVDEDGEGLGNTDGVRELDEGSLGEAGSDEGLGDPSGSVRGGSVDLGPVLSGESSTTVGSPTTVRVDDDLSAGETGVTLRATDDESARRLDVVDGSVVEEVLGDDGLDDLLEDLGSEVLGRDLLGVLRGDDDGVDSEGNDRAVRLLLVLDGDLRLRVGSEPAERTVSSGSGHRGVELVRERDRQGHHLGRLVRGVAEHDTLVTGTDLLERTVVETLRNVRGLLLDGNEDVARLVVETLVRVVVADLLDRVSDDRLVVDLGSGRDLTEDLESVRACWEKWSSTHHDHTGLGGRLTGDLGERVLA